MSLSRPGFDSFTIMAPSEEIPAGNHGTGRGLHRLRQRRLADIFLVNGMDWPGHVQKHSTPRLYHNNHDGTFTDVTHKLARRRTVWNGRASVTTITTASTIFSSPPTGRAAFFTTTATARSRMSHKKRACWGPRIQHQRRLGGLRQGRPSGLVVGN